MMLARRKPTTRLELVRDPYLDHEDPDRFFGGRVGGNASIATERHNSEAFWKRLGRISRSSKPQVTTSDQSPGSAWYSVGDITRADLGGTPLNFAFRIPFSTPSIHPAKQQTASLFRSCTFYRRKLPLYMDAKKNHPPKSCHVTTGVKHPSAPCPRIQTHLSPKRRGPGHSAFLSH